MRQLGAYSTRDTAIVAPGSAGGFVGRDLSGWDLSDGMSNWIYPPAEPGATHHTELSSVGGSSGPASDSGLGRRERRGGPSSPGGPRREPRPSRMRW